MESLLNDETNYLGPLSGPLNLHELNIRRDSSAAEEHSRNTRMMLSRMNSLESGFRDMLREVKDWKAASSRGTSVNEANPNASVTGRKIARRMEKRRDGEGSGLRPRSGNSGGGSGSGSSRPNSGPAKSTLEAEAEVRIEDRTEERMTPTQEQGRWYELERQDTAVKSVQQTSGGVERPEMPAEMKSY